MTCSSMGAELEGHPRQRGRVPARRADRELPVRRRSHHRPPVAVACQPAFRRSPRRTTGLATKEARAVLPRHGLARRCRLQPAASAAAGARGRKRTLRRSQGSASRSLASAGSIARSSRDCARRSPSIDPAVLGVCLSGSGPSIVALPVPGREQEAVAALSDVYRRISLPATIRVLAAHQPIGASAALDLIERENTA